MLCVLGTAILKSKIRIATFLIGNSLSEAGSSSDLDRLTRTGLEWDNQNDELIYGLAWMNTEVYRESQIGLQKKWNERHQDKF